MRNWYRDNPVADAEDWASREDPRPVAGKCKICGALLHNGYNGWDPDDGYEIDGDVICADHLHEYCKNWRLK
jgi:hypothetical protein